MKNLLCALSFLALISGAQAFAADEKITIEKTAVEKAAVEKAAEVKAQDVKPAAPVAAPATTTAKPLAASSKEDATKRTTETVKTEEATKEETAKQEVKDTCGGAARFLGLRTLAKDEVQLPGSHKIDVSKLPQGTRVYKANEPHPEQNVYTKDNNPKRLNLILDHRSIIVESFCG